MAKHRSFATTPPARRSRFSAAVLAALLACAVALLGALGAGPAGAAKSDEEKLEAVEAKLGKAQRREGVLTRDIAALGKRISALEGLVSGLRNEEAAVERRLRRKQAELDRAAAELAQAMERLDVMRERLRRALIELRRRLVEIYMHGPPDMTAVVLAAKDYGDVLATAEYLDALRESDERLAARVRELRDRAKRLVRIRREAKLRIQAARDAIAAEEARLEATRSRLESQQARLVSARGRRKAALDSVRRAIDQHEEVAAELRAKIQARLAAATGGHPLPAGPMPSPSAAGLIWPVNGVLTSGFGARWGRMHEGIDIAAPEGTPIRAAASGTVVLIQGEASSGGYGNFTCVDHGGGLSTCYAHQSSIATSSGARVSQGQVIGYVGNTGHSFGAHLHFEVRINGAPTDPMGYL